MTDFGPAEQSRLAELLRDEFKRTCLTCEGVIAIYSNTKPVRCRSCDGRGFHSSVPTGLILIEECRKRGVFVFILPGKESYNVYTMILGTFEPSNVQYCVKIEDLESAIAIAALEGLEALENTNECKAK